MACLQYIHCPDCFLSPALITENEDDYNKHLDQKSQSWEDSGDKLEIYKTQIIRLFFEERGKLHIKSTRGAGERNTVLLSRPLLNYSCFLSFNLIGALKQYIKSPSTLQTPSHFGKFFNSQQVSTTYVLLLNKKFWNENLNFSSEKPRETFCCSGIVGCELVAQNESPSLSPRFPFPSSKKLLFIRLLNGFVRTLCLKQTLQLL